MSNARPISDYSRQELYDLIWSTPANKLATDFGISDVAIAKRCKNRNVPRPSRGYWAKVAAGRTPRKVPLPPTPGEVFKEEAQRRVAKTLPLPENAELLVPLASELTTALSKAKLDSYKRAYLSEPAFPAVTASKALAERVARSFHAILSAVEPLGIPFRKSRSSGDSGYFERRYDRLHLTIAEDLVQPDGTSFTARWYDSHRANAKPSGYLTLSLNPDRYGSQNVQQWSESNKLPLEELLAQVVTAIRKHYVDAQERREKEAAEREKQRLEWERRHREWQQQEAIRLQQEKERQHAQALAVIEQGRKAALLKAAENWRTSKTMLEFLEACEARWKSQPAPLAPEQLAWLTWARDLANAMSPFSAGYPNPTADGAFDPSSVPFGGPYPATRHFPQL